MFKDEIATRFKSRHLPTLLFLLKNHYLGYLNQEEQKTLFEDIDFTVLTSNGRYNFSIDFKELIKLGVLNTKDKYELFIRIYNISKEKVLLLRKIFNAHYFYYKFDKNCFKVEPIRGFGHMYLTHRYVSKKQKHLEVPILKRICLKERNTFDKQKKRKVRYEFYRRIDKNTRIRISLLQHNVRLALNLFKKIMDSREEDIKIAIPKKDLEGHRIVPYETVFKIYDRTKPLIIYLDGDSKVEHF